MKNILNILSWINQQIEWVKSFFEEITPKGKKASQKNLIGFITTVTFLYSYITVLLKKTDSITKISEIQMPDIPPMWATLIGFVLGANIFSTINNNKILKDTKKEDATKNINQDVNKEENKNE